MKYGSLIAAILILFGGVGYLLFFPAPEVEAPGQVEQSHDDIVDNNAVVDGDIKDRDDITSPEPITDTVDRIVTSFTDCVAVGNPVMESYPRQCRHLGVLYVEEVDDPIVTPTPPTQSPNEPVACTADAKICPDGSAVGRVGPHCEFAPCPEEGSAVACDDDVKICPDGSAVGRVGPSCEFASCPAEDPIDDYFVTCPPESRLVDACIEIYEPVCASAQVECITEPCDPFEQTYPNACKACMNKRVIGYTPDVCYEF